MNLEERDRLTRLEANFETHAKEERDHFIAIMETLAEIKAELAAFSLWQAQIRERHAIEDHDREEAEKQRQLSLTRRDVIFTGAGAGSGFLLFVLEYLGVLPT